MKKSLKKIKPMRLDMKYQSSEKKKLSHMKPELCGQLNVE